VSSHGLRIGKVAKRNLEHLVRTVAELFTNLAVATLCGGVTMDRAAHAIEVDADPFRATGWIFIKEIGRR
jgi:hypothetical protein